jgi:crossover junction endodeoxyribonuclease RusA
MRLEIPWPPSINHYWRRNPNGRGNFISGEGKAYLAHVVLLLKMMKLKPIEGPISIKIELNPPNKLRRDLDNCLKVLIDAIAKGGAMGDDFQIKHIEASMLEVVKDGRAVVELTPLTQGRSHDDAE